MIHCMETSLAGSASPNRDFWICEMTALGNPKRPNLFVLITESQTLLSHSFVTSDLVPYHIDPDLELVIPARKGILCVQNLLNKLNAFLC